MDSPTKIYARINRVITAAQQLEETAEEYKKVYTNIDVYPLEKVDLELGVIYKNLQYWQRYLDEAQLLIKNIK